LVPLFNFKEAATKVWQAEVIFLQHIFNVFNADHGMHFQVIQNREAIPA